MFDNGKLLSVKTIGVSDDEVNSFVFKSIVNESESFVDCCKGFEFEIKDDNGILTSGESSEEFVLICLLGGSVSSI